MGQKARQVVTNVSSLPLPQKWDGLQSLEDFSRLLREARPRKVIGVHARIYPSRPFEYFDHRNVETTGDATVWWSEFFCRGHPDSMTELGVCVGSLVEPNLTSTEHEWPTIILWSTDHDQLASRLLHDLQAIPKVIVVRISHASTNRFDTHADTGLIDMLFLGEADTLVGTTSSTYSFAAHARSLAEPRYPSFRANAQDACGRAPGTEGGLLVYGLSHDCSPRDGYRHGYPIGTIWMCHRQSKCLRYVMWAPSCLPVKALEGTLQDAVSGMRSCLVCVYVSNDWSCKGSKANCATWHSGHALLPSLYL